MRKRLVQLFLGCALSAFAGPISITITGTGSGMLGANGFTNALITITATGDTIDVGNFGGGLFVINPIPATLDITGLGSTTFSAGPEAFVNQTANFAGLATNSGIVILAVTNLGLSSFALASSIGPLSGANSLNSGLGFSTAAGDFVINEITGNGTYQATVDGAVPEPATLGFVGLGIIAFVGCRYRRTSRAA
jgi:PEP-CTERM motif